MLLSRIKKYDIKLDPPSPLWDEFRFLGNIDLSEWPLNLLLTIQYWHTSILLMEPLYLPHFSWTLSEVLTEGSGCVVQEPVGDWGGHLVNTSLFHRGCTPIWTLIHCHCRTLQLLGCYNEKRASWSSTKWRVLSMHSSSIYLGPHCQFHGSKWVNRNASALFINQCWFLIYTRFI